MRPSLLTRRAIHVIAVSSQHQATRPGVAYWKGGLRLPDHIDTRETAYTRRQAIRDGQLIDVSDLARVDLLRAPHVPVALTDTAWNRLQASGAQGLTHGDQEAVLRILQAARDAIVSRLQVLGRTPFTVRLGRRTTALVVEVHESDVGAIVATILLDRQVSGR